MRSRILRLTFSIRIRWQESKPVELIIDSIMMMAMCGSLWLLLLAVASNAIELRSSNAVERSLQGIQPGFQMRINAGGSFFTDSEGHFWFQDLFAYGGEPYSDYSGSIANTDNDLLYQTGRSGYVFWYNILPIPNGYYNLTLHFCHVSDSEPAAEFYLDVENERYQSSVNVFEQSGGARTAWTMTSTHLVQDASLTVFFGHVQGNPSVSGVEIYYLGTDYDAPHSPETPAPTPVATTPDVVTFEPIRINCGGPAYTDTTGNVWEADGYFSGGSSYADGSVSISSTQDDTLYQTERHGTFQYELPCPDGNYQIVLHFAEIYHTSRGARIFHVSIEGVDAFGAIDVVDLGDGTALNALTLETAQIVDDGFLSIEFIGAEADQPKVSAIQVELVGAHLAHAVANGPYSYVDTNASGTARVTVDGEGSHTHAPGERLDEWIWKAGSTVLATTERASFDLPVGENTITLTVIDTAGNTHTHAAIVTVLSSEFPTIGDLSPDSGSTNGGTQVTITGSGFSYPASETTVSFGLVELSGSDIEVLNRSTIRVTAPAVNLGAPAQVSVRTPVGGSNTALYTYIAGSAIEFYSWKLTDIDQPTVVAFGPDRRLYVGNVAGKLFRISFEEGTYNINGWQESTVAQWRAILGITFDPLDDKSYPDVYFAHSYLFHGENDNSSGEAINGKVSIAKGSNMDNVEDLITGLPVSDHDHGINGIEFGDEGELYVQVGGNTNAGIKGSLSSGGQMKEGVLSASTLVAYVSKSNFDGRITYNADDEGEQTGGWDVEVFASGQRNPYDIVLHSNGYLYGTDNGPNYGYGPRSLSCSGRSGTAPEEPDELNLIERGNFYGHANPSQGECVWRSIYDSGDSSYTPPIAIVPASMNGIIEWTTNHFGGQMRGNLVLSKFLGSLYRVILSPDGRGVLPESKPPIYITGDDGLDVAQAPQGALIEVRYESSKLYLHEPIEDSTSSVLVYSVFPRRGGLAGGNLLSIYGKNFDKSSSVSVEVGGSSCSVEDVSDTIIECELPGGSGTVDVVVNVGSETSVFQNGYRYIRGY